MPSHRTDQPLRISVVIPHLNQPEMLRRCLESIRDGARRPDQLVVVDNGSDHLPRELCDEHGVLLLKEATPGPGPARNTGVAASDGDVVAFIDADCIADPSWLAEAEAAIGADPTAQVLGGDVRIWRQVDSRPTALEAYESIYAYRMDRYIANSGFTGTGNLIVRREVLDEVGPFAGIDIAEDVDWCHRAARRGYPVKFAPQARVYHPARQNIDELKAKWDRQTAHFYVTSMARPAGRLRWGLRAVAIALSPPAELVRILLSDRVSGVRARSLAALCMTRIRLHRARTMLALLAGRDPSQLSGQWNRRPAGEPVDN